MTPTEKAGLEIQTELLQILFAQCDMRVVLAAMEARCRLLVAKPPNGCTKRAIAATSEPLLEMLRERAEGKRPDTTVIHQRRRSA